MSKKILVVDDENIHRESVRDVLVDIGYKVVEAVNTKDAVNKFTQDIFDLVITDMRMPLQHGEVTDIEGGLKLIKELKRLDPRIPIIVMTAYGKVENAAAALQLGADDYIFKPFDIDELEFRVRKTLKLLEISDENILLKEEALKFGGDIIGKSKAMQQVWLDIQRVANLDTTVLIQGESGVGKELVARAIHAHSKRCNKSFVPVNCAAIPETLLESELFGIAKKSGIHNAPAEGKPGKFELADGGTIFLDEIGDMDISTQTKILRVLQEKEIERLGSTQRKKVDIRIIAATNHDLNTRIKQGKFREDLYFRLNIYPITVPPLRERREDIEELVKYFIQKYAKEFKKDVVGIHPETMKRLMLYNWPGNVRELENIIQRMIIRANGKYLEIDESLLPYDSYVSTFEQTIDEILSTEGGSDTVINKFHSLLAKAARRKVDTNKKAAEMLGVTRKTLAKWLKQE